MKMISENRFKRLFSVTVAIFLVFALFGCGKKGAPRFVDKTAPNMTVELKAAANGKIPLLRWKVHVAGGAVQNIRFKIQRSEIRPGGCLDCPHDYAVIGESTDPGPSGKSGEMVYQYRDAEAKAGLTYTYRILACDWSGSSLGRSNAAVITVP